VGDNAENLQVIEAMLSRLKASQRFDSPLIALAANVLRERSKKLRV
jgi:hypothetical protein